MDDSLGMCNEKRPWRVVEWVVWACVCVLALLCCGWVVGEWVYWVDLMSAFVVQGVVVCVVFGIGLLVFKRRRRGLVCLVAACVGLVPVVSGRGLGIVDAGIGEQVVRVGSLNMYPRNESWENDLATMMGLNLDVLVVQELPIEMSRRVRGLLGEEGMLVGTGMPHWLHRAWVDEEVSPGFIISRYPLELIEPGDDDVFGHHQLMCVVHHPEGDFVVGLMHPWSPRTSRRWREGNAVVRGHRGQVERVLEETGLAMIVGADMNSSRAQYRSRELRGSGLRPSKPMMVFEGGSFPVGVPGIMQIQIDDLWVSDGVGVTSWGMLEVAGSDHRAVVGGFVIRRVE